MSVPVISVAQMREWERASWSAGKSESEVIQHVGQIIARRMLELTQHGQTILVVAGKGHNGEDARAAQAYLADRDVRVLNVESPRGALEEFSQYLESRKAAGHGSSELWIIDGLFGIGLNRMLDQDWQELIGAINACGMPVLAVDVPSGLNAETGQVEGAAIRARVTLTVGAPKRGMLLPRAHAFVGRLEAAPEIGLIPCPITSDLHWVEPNDFAQFPPARQPDTHKGSYGHVAICAGSLGYHGAAVLAARGALRAQPGLVTVFPQEVVYQPVAAQLQAAMVHPWKGTQALPKSCTSMLVGPGLAAAHLPEQLKNEMRWLWQSSPLPIVCDASALDWLRNGPVLPSAPRVITPHPGEAARLLGTSTESVQADRVGAVRELSRRFGNCYVVLKGHQTLVGLSQGIMYVNSSGNPVLAQGGSGDVLAGYLAGLLAQPALQRDVLKTIRFAVWSHGHAADRLSQLWNNWTVEELIQQLGSV